ncbi:hypothetical protein, partial [Acinetobacter baumannii]
MAIIESCLPTGTGDSAYYFLIDFSAPNAIDRFVNGVEVFFWVAVSFVLRVGVELLCFVWVVG